MRLTEKGLIEAGILKVDGKHNFLNAVIDCWPEGGTKGIWIDGEYYRAEYSIGQVYFNFLMPWELAALRSKV